MILKTNINGDGDWQNLEEEEKDDNEDEEEGEDLGKENWGNALGDDEDDDFAN